MPDCGCRPHRVRPGCSRHDRNLRTARPARARATELSAEEMAALIEGRTQAAFGMTVDEFRKALDDGRIDVEDPGVAGLAILV